MNSGAGTAVEISDAVKEYAPGRGVCGITLHVGSGECVALLGRNGSGKSTLTRLVLGLEEPAGGSVRVLGQNPSLREQSFLGLVGVALDTPVHWERLTGRQNARFIARSYGLDAGTAEQRIDVLFDAADLAGQADDPVAAYSYGMRRKLSLVEAVLHDPVLLVLDEPTSGVDAQFMVQLAAIVKDRCERGKTTWIAGNDPEWTAGIATHVAFVDRGMISAHGTVSDLVSLVSAQQEITVELGNPVAIPPVQDTDVASFEQHGGTITALAAGGPSSVSTVMDWIIKQGGAPTRMDVRSPSLRDVFLLKTGRTLDG